MFISEWIILILIVILLSHFILAAIASNITKVFISFIVIIGITMIITVVTAWTRAEIKNSLIKNNKIEYKVTEYGETYLSSQDSSFNEVVDILEFGSRRENDN